MPGLLFQKPGIFLNVDIGLPCSSRKRRRSMFSPANCYPIGFLSDSSYSLIPVSSAYIFIHMGWRTLVGRLYLFTTYALRYGPAFRNPNRYLGVCVSAFTDFARLLPAYYYAARPHVSMYLSYFLVSIGPDTSS